MQKALDQRPHKKTVLPYILLSLILLLLIPLSHKKELDLVKSVKEMNSNVSNNPTLSKLNTDGKQFYEKWCERSKRSMDQSRILFRKISLGISEFGRYSKIMFHTIFSDSSFADSRGSD